ncbi:PLP-dependent transferase, partial [Finegoldia magna]|uniref:PLP-dependent transferase n=1 Tax=Finegoldia magna TaxID=1260 RepID=UPI0028FF66DC
TTSFVFDDTQEGADLFALRKPGNIYTRITNPTTAAFEERIAALEGGVGALATASGMAAVTYTILALAHAGDHVVAASTIYGGTFNLLKETLPRYGITTTFVDVDNLLNILVKKYSLLFINSHISLDFRKNGLKCITDSKWLSVLLEQILSNAIKYSENSQIILDSFRKDNSVVILIEDKGIGIPEEDINRIFDKGYSGFNGRLKQKSSGLGLYLAKSIADKLDIRLKVDSTVGQGSKFYVIVNN